LIVLARRQFDSLDQAIESMNLTKRWLIIVLICGLQLVVALSMAIWATNKFECRILALLCDRSTAESGRIARTLLREIPESTDQTRELDRQAGLLGELWGNIVDVDHPRLFLVDFERAEMIRCPVPSAIEHHPPTAFDVSELELKNLGNSQSQPLLTWLRNPAAQDIRGCLKIGEVDYFATAYRLAGSRAIVVGFDAHRATADFSLWMNGAKSVCLTSVLLLGFVTIFLTTSIMQKFEVQLVRFHEQLQAMVERRTSELEKTKNGIIFGLAKLAESRDNDTGDHLDRIRHYVVALATELQSTYSEIDDKFIVDIALASSLHDIGKVGIPDAVLLKPGRLTDLERKIMQFHPLIGHECLEAIKARIGTDDFLQMASEICHYHHERWDGKGYPEGISGNDIPLSARIVAVADVYDALTSRRPYKEPFSHDKSCEIICKEAGSQFDPVVIEAFRVQANRFRSIMETHRECADDNSIVPAIARLQEALVLNLSTDVSPIILSTVGSPPIS
jgi:putative two-component system response regulator